MTDPRTFNTLIFIVISDLRENAVFHIILLTFKKYNRSDRRKNNNFVVNSDVHPSIPACLLRGAIRVNHAV